jgi:hypothetical protein
MTSIEEKREMKLYAKFQDRISDQISDLISLGVIGFFGFSKAEKIGMLKPFLFLIIYGFLHVSYKLTHPVTFEQFKLNEEKRQMKIAAIKAYIYANRLTFIMIVFIVVTLIKSIK